MMSIQCHTNHERNQPAGRRLLWLLLLVLFWLAAPAGLQAQVSNGITAPASGDTVSGVVVIQGTATAGSFLRYELAFNNGTDWIVFAEGDRPVINGTLAIWDTTVGAPAAPVFPDGTYQLRLRVVRQDHNYDEFFVSNITVANAGAQTATPTPTETATPEEGVPPDEGPDPGAGGPATPTLPATLEGLPPAVLPSLTPFPTPSPQATPQNVVVAGGARPAGDDTEGSGGVIDQIRAIDTSQFGRAFWQGVKWAFYLFLALGAYLLLRNTGRWLWRRLLIERSKHDH